MMATGRVLAAVMLLLATAGIAPAVEANKPILDSAQRQQPGAIKLWERLVNIDSGTGDMEGVNAVGAVAVEELKKLGAAIEMVPALAGLWRQHRREPVGLGQRQDPADRPYGHGVQEGRCRGAAVPHRRRTRLWSRRVGRQGRDCCGAVGAENSR